MRELLGVQWTFNAIYRKEDGSISAEEWNHPIPIRPTTPNRKIIILADPEEILIGMKSIGVIVEEMVKDLLERKSQLPPLRLPQSSRSLAGNRSQARQG